MNRRCLFAAIAGVTGVLALPSAAFACDPGGGSATGGGATSFAGAFGGNVLGALGEIVSAALSAPTNSGSSRSTPRAPETQTTTTVAGGRAIAPPASTSSFGPLPADFWTREPPEPPPAIPHDDAECECEPESRRTTPIGHFLELSVGLPFQSLAGNTMQWGGWSGHPVLSEQMESETSAPGSRLGIGRINLVGATARVSAVLARYLTVAAQAGVLEQANTNETTHTSTPFRPGRVHGFEVGAEVGVLVPMGRVFTARAGVFTGYRRLYSPVEGIGLGGCTSIPVISSGQLEVVPRVQVTASLSEHVTVGAYVGLDVLRPTDVSGGLIVGFHGGTFAPGMAPATSATP